MSSGGLTGRLLRLVSLVVPRDERQRWLEEWRAELWHLENRPPLPGSRRSPSAVALCLGAIPHSLWERKEWTVSVLLQDVRFASRVLLRSPAFTLVAVITMALGIGANTTIFSMTNATLFRAPDAIDAPERIVQIGRDRPDQGFDNMGYPWFRMFRERAAGLESLAAYTSRAFVLGRGSAVEVVNGQLVTGEYFELLGVQAAHGRVLSPSDDVLPDGRQVAIISNALWRSRFASDPAIVGADTRINGSDYTIVGVAEDGFQGTDVVGGTTDVWIPLSTAGTALGPAYREFDQPGFSWLWMVGRLAPGATDSGTAAEINGMYAPAFTEFWGEAPEHTIGVIAGVGLRPEERAIVGQLMSLLSGIVAIVLAVACANLANLLLARGVRRSQELGVRAALGAGRTRLLRQLLTESVLLALGGGMLAFALTYWTARLIPLLVPIPLGVSFHPDMSVFLFASGLSLLAGVLFGTAPALRASRSDVVASLRESAHAGGSGGGWMRNTLVVSQLALAFVLLAATGLLLQSLGRANSADPGYATRDVMTASLDLDLSGYDSDSGETLLETLLRDTRALPGVVAAATGSNLPFAGWSRQSVVPPEPRPDWERPYLEIDTSVVSDGYFETLQIPLLAGEVFHAGNSDSRSRPAVIISGSAARLLWPQSDPVGQLLPTTEDRDPEQSLLVVGVVADVQVRSLQQPARPSIYLPRAQHYDGAATLFVRTSTDAAAIARPLRALIQRHDPDLGIMQMGGLGERMGGSLRQTLAVARLGGVFGLLALLLAAVGLYGVVSYVASSRTHEVGVRMALGARRPDVLRLFVAQALRIGLVGVAVGVLLTAAASSVLSGLLYGISPRDPWTLVAIATTVLALSIAAALVPARRATAVNPVRALRQG